MPAKSPKGPGYRVEYRVVAVVSVEIDAESPEKAPEAARTNARAWALEGLEPEVCDSNIRVVGVSENGAWDVEE